MERKIIYDQFKENYLLYKFDQEHDKKTKPIDIFPFFTTEKNLKRICDYILFVQKEELLYGLAIELKSGDSSRQQLEAAEEFIRFIFSSAKRISSEEPKIDWNNTKIKKIRISGNDSKMVDKNKVTSSGKHFEEASRYNHYINLWKHKRDFKFSQLYTLLN